MKQQPFTPEIEESLAVYDQPIDDEQANDFPEDVLPRRMVQDDWLTEETEPPPKPATKEEAMFFLTAFFRKRESHCGGPIPATDLLTNRHIEMVLRLELSDCLDIFHECLETLYFGLPKKQRTRLYQLHRRVRLARAEWGKVPHEEKEKMPDPLDAAERKLYKWLRIKMKISHTELLKKLQKQSYDMAIPRHHSGGILLVWLRMCMGFDI